MSGAHIDKRCWRPHREPASRVAWVVVILVLPIVGILAYVLLGETSIGRRRVARPSPQPLQCFTIGHSLLLSGRAASSAGTVASSFR